MTFPLDPANVSYHYGNAYWMARLTVAANRKIQKSQVFKGETKTKKILDRELSANGENPLNSVTGFDIKGVQAILIDHPKFIGIAFRKTNSARDALCYFTDTKLIQISKSYPGKYNSGSYKALMKIWKDIRKAQNRIETEQNKPIWFTGHSLGGAMASIAAAIYTANGWAFKGIYTFGQAACMDQDAANALNKSTKNNRFFRFHSYKDNVPLISPTAKQRHMGEGIYINEQKDLYWSNMRLDRWRGGLTLGKNHNQAHYLGSIKLYHINSCHGINLTPI